MASLIQRYNGNYYIAICAYNAGIGNVNKWIDNEIIDTSLDTTQVELPFSETENYLKRVIHYYTMYKKIYKNLWWLNKTIMQWHNNIIYTNIMSK